MGVYKLRQLLVRDEASFNENAESGSPSFTDNIPVTDATLELTQERTPDAAVQSRLAARGLSHPNVRSAKLTFTMYWAGNQTTTASTVSTTVTQAKLLI